MGDLLQSRKREEAAGALDGVNGPENTGQKGSIFRTQFQLNQILIQAREIFMAFNEELTNYVLIVLHALFLQRTRMIRRHLGVPHLRLFLTPSRNKWPIQ